MDIEVGTLNGFPQDAAGNRELERIERCEACETRPAAGMTGLCTWCGPQVAGVLGEMQA